MVVNRGIVIKMVVCRKRVNGNGKNNCSVNRKRRELVKAFVKGRYLGRDGLLSFDLTQIFNKRTSIIQFESVPETGDLLYSISISNLISGFGGSGGGGGASIFFFR